MIEAVKKGLDRFIKEDARTIKASKNIFYSFIIKAASLAITFLIVSTTLDYIDSRQYGIWLTLTSVFSWFVIFDFGMGNGLRSKLGEVLAKENYQEAKIIISSTYAFLIIVGFLIVILFTIGFFLADLFNLLSYHKLSTPHIREIILICSYSFIIQLIFQLINSILLAYHEASRSALIILIGQMFSLLCIVVLKYTTDSSLFLLSLAVTLPPLIVYFVGTLFFFNSLLRPVAPSFKYINFASVKSTGNYGWKFFIISISVALLYFSSNIVINYLFGPEQVTVYNICYKYFNVFTFGFGIIVTPFWSSYADAYHKKEFSWIRTTMRKLLILWGCLVFLVLVAILFSEMFYKLWIGPKIKVPMLLSVCMGLYVLVNAWNTIYLYFLNGIGAVTIQLIIHVMNIIIVLPLMFVLAKQWGIGLPGIIIAHLLCQLMFTIMAPVQVNKILSNNPSGIWKK